MVKLFNGDCFEVIQKLVQEGIQVDCIITDIPYQISKDSNFNTMRDRKRRTGTDFGEWDKYFDCTSLSILSSLLKKDGTIVLFHSFEQYNVIKETFEQSGLVCKDRIIWEKTNPMPRNRDRRYISNCELGSWYVKQKAKWTFNRQDPKFQKMVFRYPSESGGGYTRYHPTQKNLKLIEELVQIHTNKNDLVLDCFMGSGTTGVACVNKNRNFIGIELNKNYFDLANNRIKDSQQEKSCELDFGE